MSPNDWNYYYWPNYSYWGISKEEAEKIVLKILRQYNLIPQELKPKNLKKCIF